ncbi:hypothetical protein SH449x_000592 [Pirellulaceae bacterium SH449]
MLKLPASDIQAPLFNHPATKGKPEIYKERLRPIPFMLRLDGQRGAWRQIDDDDEREMDALSESVDRIWKSFYLDFSHRTFESGRQGCRRMVCQAQLRPQVVHDSFDRRTFPPLVLRQDPKPAEGALMNWKALFAEQVAVKAKELAEKSGSAGVITLGHYRQAATIAVQMLASEVQCTDSHDGRQEAA